MPNGLIVSQEVTLPMNVMQNGIKLGITVIRAPIVLDVKNTVLIKSLRTIYGNGDDSFEATIGKQCIEP